MSLLKPLSPNDESLMSYEEAKRKIEAKEVPEFSISDSSIAKVGSWYLSKRGSLARIDELLEDGEVLVTSHVTGNKIKVPPEQLLFFKPADEPDTEPGTLLLENSDSDIVPNTTNKYSDMYTKYPHVIDGSIYRVKNISNKEKKFVRGKKTKIKGQVRCKIECILCGNERDIKVQDAFQVKYCLDCKNKKKRKNLDKFLKNKKNEK